MVKRLKIESYFILILGAITLLLFRYKQMDKNAYYEIDSNPTFEYITWIIIGALAIFNHFIIKYKVWLNILITFIVAKLSIPIAKFIFTNTIRGYGKITTYESMLQQLNYKWFELLIIGITMVILTELIIKIREKTLKNIKHKSHD